MPWRLRGLAIGHHRIGSSFDFRDQVTLDPEHYIAVEILVALHEDVSDQRLVPRRLDKEMYMRRPHRRAPCLQYHLAHRAVRRDRVAARQDGAEEETPIGIGDETGPRGRRLRLVARLL